jgi:hypothetical protein
MVRGGDVAERRKDGTIQFVVFQLAHNFSLLVQVSEKTGEASENQLNELREYRPFARSMAIR